MTKNSLIKIGGVDVTSKRMSMRIEDEYLEKIGKVIIQFRFDVNTLTTLAKFQDVVVWENFSGTLEVDANRKFIGNISKIEREVGTITVTAFDPLWKAIQTEVNQTYDVNIDSEAGEGSEIFIDLATQAGLTADSGTVQATGTSASDLILDKFVCKRAEIYERMQALADIYEFQFYHRPATDKIHFEPEGFTLNVNVLRVGGTNGNVQGFPKWVEDATKVFNRVEIIGAFDEVKKTESFDGTGAQTTFTLEFEPEIVTVTVDSVEQTGGVTGSTETFDYTVDKSNKQIIFESGSIPANGTDNVVILYSYREPRTVVLDNEASQAPIVDGGLGRIITNRFTFKDIQSVDDAERRGDKLLDVFANEFVTTKFKVDPAVIESFALEAGQSIRVVDERQSKDLIMVVKKMITRTPENDVELILGDREVSVGTIDFDHSKRFKRLEEEEAKAGTFVVARKTPVHGTNVERRDLRTNDRDIEADVLYWDTVDQGIWGNDAGSTGFDWGDDTDGTFVVQRVIQANNDVYDENFNDTDYKDTGNTTATWGGNGAVAFTSGQVAQTESIEKSNGTIVSATLNSTETSGTLLYELAADYIEPIAHYKMNDDAASTVVLDSSGSNDGAATVNTDTISIAGTINKAFNLDGSSENIDVPDDASLDMSSVDGFTIALWIKPNTALTSTDALVSKATNGSTKGYEFLLANTNKLDLIIGDGSANSDIRSIQTITFDVWQHVAVTWDAGTGDTIFYINGTSEAAQTSKTSILNDTKVLELGARFSSQFFNGAMDDVRIYNKILSGTEISTIYNSGNGTEENGNWETVTSLTKHFFTNTGTDLRMRVTENAATTAGISNIKIEVFH